jgi:type I restriction enzyme S subunit
VSGVHLAPDEYDVDGEVPYFTGPSDFSNDVNAISKWTTESTNIARRGDTLITVKGSGCGELMFLELPKVAMGRQLMAARPKNCAERFVLYLLETKRKRFEDLASGNLIPGLSRGDILDLELPLPKEEAEQHRIADCLSSLDATITAQAEKLDALRTHKRGLMQQLFPSPEGVQG